MRRNGLLVGGWAVATLLALVLGLQGIRSVSNSVTTSRPAPLSPASVKAALRRTNAVSAAATSTVPAASSASTQSSGDDRSSSARTGPSAGSVDPSGNANGDGPGPSSFVVPAPTTQPATGGNAGVGSASSSSTSGSDRSGDSSSSSESSSTESSSSSSSDAPVDKTYQLVGGSVGVRFEDGAAHLLWATPKSGFNVETSNDGGTVDVRFESDNHESRLRAYWANGPQQQIEEQDHG